jgi:hypothetical protein
MSATLRQGTVDDVLVILANKYDHSKPPPPNARSGIDHLRNTVANALASGTGCTFDEGLHFFPVDELGWIVPPSVRAAALRWARVMVRRKPGGPRKPNGKGDHLRAVEALKLPEPPWPREPVHTYEARSHQEYLDLMQTDPRPHWSQVAQQRLSQRRTTK